jgi:hypothetical protein
VQAEDESGVAWKIVLNQKRQYGDEQFPFCQILDHIVTKVKKQRHVPALSFDGGPSYRFGRESFPSGASTSIIKWAKTERATEHDV